MRQWMFFLLLLKIANVMSGNAIAQQPVQPKLPQRPQVSVRVDDIGESVTLVGRLGKPLGTKLQLRGQWLVDEAPPRILHTKRSSVRFVVFEVNGNKLAENVEFDYRQVTAELLKWSSDDHRTVPTRANAMPHKPKSLSGKVWAMTAYETGSFNGVPNEYGDKQVVFPVVSTAYSKLFKLRLIGVVTSIDGEPCD